MVASVGLTPIELLTMLAAAAEALVCSVLVRRERTKRRLAESDVDESRARMVEMQQLARIGNWEFDLLNDRIRWTEETFRIFGIPPGSQEPEFADVLLAIEDEDKSVFDAAIQGAITEGRPYSLDLRIRTPEGTQKFIHAQGTAVYAATGTVVRLIGTVLDITERKWEENRLATAATHDSLTGLANRSCFSMELERELSSSSIARSTSANSSQSGPVTAYSTGSTTVLLSELFTRSLSGTLAWCGKASSILS